VDNTSVRNTLEIMYLMSELFYGEDKSDWPESAKLFYDRMAVAFVKLVIGSGMKVEELKRILEEEI
jgi:hypothetical protein